MALCSNSDVVSLTMSDHNSLLLTGHRNGSLTILDMNAGQPCWTLPKRKIPCAVCRCRLNSSPPYVLRRVEILLPQRGDLSG